MASTAMFAYFKTLTRSFLMDLGNLIGSFNVKLAFLRFARCSFFHFSRNASSRFLSSSSHFRCFRSAFRSSASPWNISRSFGISKLGLGSSTNFRFFRSSLMYSSSLAKSSSCMCSAFSWASNATAICFCNSSAVRFSTLFFNCFSSTSAVGSRVDATSCTSSTTFAFLFVGVSLYSC